MAKYQDTIETLISARNEVATELRAAERQLHEQASRENRRAKDAEQQARNRATIERRMNDDLAAQAEAREQRKAALARESDSIQQQITQSRLRASGQHMEADLQQVRAGFAQRIAAAQAANQTELVNRLTTLRTIREQEVRAAHAAARDSAGGDSGGLTGRIRGMSNAAKLLVGGGVLAGFDIMGKRLAAAVDKSAELVEQFKAGAISGRQLTAGLLQGLPVLGGWIEAGGKIRAWLDGSLERMNNINKAVEKGNEALAEMRKQFAAEAALRETDKTVGEDIAVNDKQGAARKVLEIEQKLARDIAEVQKKAKEAQRDADDPRTAATIAKLRERASQETSKAIGDELTERRNAEVARQRAAEDAEAKITELRLQHQGKTLEAELHSIRTATAARVRAAKEGGNAELAAHEQKLGEMQEEEAKLLDNRRQQIERIERQREGIEEKMRSDAEALNRAKSRADVTGPAAADQNRFLTGVRQESDRADQAMKTEAQKQIKTLEQQLEAQKKMAESLQKLIEEIRKAPIVRVDGEDL